MRVAQSLHPLGMEDARVVPIVQRDAFEFRPGLQALVKTKIGRPDINRDSSRADKTAENPRSAMQPP